MTMAFVRANGVVLHIADNRRRDAPAIVFGNSLGSDFRIWRDVAERLAGHYRILLYDKRGHGLSDAPPGPYTIDDHAADLLALLDHVGIAGTVVVGVSVGGMVAQRLAGLAPERVKALVLCSTAVKIGTPESWTARIDSVRSGGIASIADAILANWFTPGFRRGRGADYEGWRNMLVRTPVEGYVGTCAALRDADLRAGAGWIAAPTLCLAGAHDGSTPPDLVRSTANLIPGARFAVIEGAAHIPSVEKPDVLADLIGNHLREVGHG